VESDVYIFLSVTLSSDPKVIAVWDSMFSRLVPRDAELVAKLVPRDAELVAKLALSSDPAQADN